MTLFFLLPLALAADNDGDGYADGQSFGLDCNDADANVHPGATELPNDSVDQDCDGQNDPLVSTYARVCPSFSTPAEARALLDPAPVDSFGASILNTWNLAAGLSCMTVDGDTLTGSCTLAADGIGAEGIVTSQSAQAPPLDCDGVVLPCNDDSSQSDAWIKTSSAATNVGAIHIQSYSRDYDQVDTEGHGYEWYAHINSYTVSGWLLDGDSSTFSGGYASFSEGASVPWGSFGAWSRMGDNISFQADGCSLSVGYSMRSEDYIPTDYSGWANDGVHSLSLGFGGEICGVDTSPYLVAVLDGVSSLVDMTTWAALSNDQDGDGWPESLGDCDDSDATINPCAQPSEDVDHDGAPASCDCDDHNAARGPYARESCNGIDADCDGLIDEADPDNLSTTYYYDRDGDGYGAPDETVVSCHWSSDYVTNGRDCDDNDASISPSQGEVPNDGIDQDCDGRAYHTPSDSGGTADSGEVGDSADTGEVPVEKEEEKGASPVEEGACGCNGVGGFPAGLWLVWLWLGLRRQRR
jgi:hypothetical protein